MSRRSSLRASAVRVGEYAASPWVDQNGGPRGSGYIMEARDLPGIRSKDQSRMNLYDRVVLAPPVGAVAPEHELYLSYRLGPVIEGFGQIVIPTGVIEIVRSPRNGEAAIGRVVKMFGEVLQNQRLIAYDSSAAIGSWRSAAGDERRGRHGFAGSRRSRCCRASRTTSSSTSRVARALRPAIRSSCTSLASARSRRQASRFPSSTSVAHRCSASHRTARRRSSPAHEQPRIEDGTAVRIAAKMP